MSPCGPGGQAGGWAAVGGVGMELSVGIRSSCPVRGSFASWYPIGMGPAGDTPPGGSHGVSGWECGCG